MNGVQPGSAIQLQDPLAGAENAIGFAPHRFAPRPSDQSICEILRVRFSSGIPIFDGSLHLFAAAFTVLQWILTVSSTLDAYPPARVTAIGTSRERHRSKTN